MPGTVLRTHVTKSKGEQEGRGTIHEHCPCDMDERAADEAVRGERSCFQQQEIRAGNDTFELPIERRLGTEREAGELMSSLGNLMSRAQRWVESAH